ncbi:SprB repeat-containing protein, partial [Bizionia myxarmorum]
MKKLYAIKVPAHRNIVQLLLVTIMLLGASFYSFGQVREPFTPRTSDFSPSKTVYNVKGDFTMAGNTNLTLVNYSDTKNNSNNDMKFVDVDGDPLTKNSSSSTLKFSEENGATPSCSNIVYAGLYWSGRSNANNFTDLQRRTVKFKGPGQSYQTIVADAGDIRYPGDAGMYAGYKEVTNIVRNGGIGDYFVADMALTQGDGGSTGYYGGWGLVVVYENSKMDWRDVTVFDGYAYVVGGTAQHTINVSGFKAVQNGPVNFKLGMMAGEGDVGISGDYFQIKRQSDNQFQSLSHSGNSANNFFNSSILTGGNARNLNRKNNTGIDIAMFDVANTNNSIIDNNQTSTQFRYGSTGDTYIIYNVIFSVVAYVPESEGLLSANTINGAPATQPYVVEPGDVVQYGVEIRNRGTEAITNGKLVIPIPYTSQFVPGSISYNEINPLFTSSPPYFAPNLGATGSIVWDISYLPLNINNLNELMASITFELTSTTDCAILINNNCAPKIVIVGGNISGTGVVSQSNYSLPLIQGYQQNGVCQGEPNINPIEIDIDSAQYIIDNCTNVSVEREFFYCDFQGNTIPVSAVSANFPPGSRFYNSYPVTDSSTQYTVNNPFPATIGITTYYAVPPGDTGCSYIFTIEVNEVTTSPTTSNVTYCLGETAVPLTATPTNPSYVLLYYTDNTTNDGLTSLTPSTNIAGTFTYYVAEGPSTTCTGDRSPITVTVLNPITITLNSLTNTGCSGGNSGAIDISVIGGTGPYTYSWNNAGNATTQDLTGLPAGTYTVTVSDTNSNCSATADYEIILENSTPPTLIAPDAIVMNGCNATDISVGSETALDFNIAITTITEAQFLAEGGTFTANAVASITYQDKSLGTCPVGVVRTYTITDDCDQTATATQTFTINTPPLVISTINGSGLVNCAAEATETFTVPTITDACGNTITPSAAAITNSPDPITCEGTRTYTYTFTDCNNNEATWSYVYTIEYLEFDTITATSAPADCYAGIVLPTLPSVTDACGNVLTPTGPVESSTPTCEGAVTYTWTYTDCAGNTQDYVHTANITLPEFDTITATSAPADCYAGIVLPTLPSVTDACGNVLTPTGPVESSTPSCEGAVTYTWTYTDCAGNTQDYVHTANIALPEFDTITATSTPADCYASIVLPTLPSVTDACGNVLTPTGPVESSTPSCEGAVTYTWTYTDCAGNTQDYVHTANIALPEFDTITATSAPADCYAGIVLPTLPSVTDACGNVLTPTGPVESSTPSCEGAVTYTWTYTDCAGNTQDYVHTANIALPEFDTITPTSAPADCYAGIVLPTLPSVTDACGNVLTPTGPVESSTPTCEGAVTYTWTYTDCAGNTQDYVHTANIEFTAFTIDTPNGDADVACASLAVEPTPPVVVDSCGNNIVPSGPVEGGTFVDCEGTVSYTYTYTDCAGNSLDWSYVYNVQLEEIQLPANEGTQVACAADADVSLVNPPVINDSCGLPINPIGPVQGGTYDNCEGTITFTYTYPSCQGSSNEWVYTYTIVAVDFDTITATSAPADCYAGIVLPTLPSVTDACGNVLIPTGPVESSAPTCEGAVT